MICAAFGIRASATRGVRARGARDERDERDATSFRVAKTRRRRPFARTTNDERHARRRISLKRNARVDGGENAKPSSTRSSREKKKTRLSCTVCEKAFPSMWRSPPSVARVLTSRRAAERGERRDREPRDVPSWRSRVVASGTSRAGRLDVVRASRHRSRAAPISSRVSSSRRRTRRAFEREGADAETRRPCEPNTRAMDDAPRSAWSRPARAAPPSPAGP